ncbi:hypothetical protein PR048_020228 [Dryococelus australis]|uniref:Secreted protein n=1 Tax=Dryococelus australis TaxID=614101 RepID=A0ABQ9H5Q5_9NEOP|nr:hypothetical protein PR048_020228 [Dryococelus australis]
MTRFLPDKCVCLCKYLLLLTVQCLSRTSLVSAGPEGENFLVCYRLMLRKVSYYLRCQLESSWRACLTSVFAITRRRIVSPVVVLGRCGWLAGGVPLSRRYQRLPFPSQGASGVFLGDRRRRRGWPPSLCDVTRVRSVRLRHPAARTAAISAPGLPELRQSVTLRGAVARQPTSAHHSHADSQE